MACGGGPADGTDNDGVVELVIVTWLVTVGFVVDVAGPLDGLWDQISLVQKV